MRVNQRRSDVEIIAEMLRIGANGAAKTKIMYSANMSYIQMKRYLGFLTRQGYLGIVRAGNPSVTYQATERGLNLLRCIDAFIEIFGLYDD
jgi:predicted transcriptional regulator